MRQALIALALIASLGLAFISFAQDVVRAQTAPEKTFTLNVTQADLNMLAAALDEMPRKVSQPLIERLQKQLLPQMQPAPEAPKAEEKK
jgi:hypothetical protein